MIQSTKNDQRKKILFIDGAPWFGGAQRSLLGLLKGLQDRHEFQLHLLAGDTSSNGLLNHCHSGNIFCRQICVRHWSYNQSGLKDFLHDQKQFNSIFEKQQQEHQYELIHVNDPRSGLLLPRGIKTPLILHARDLRIPWVVRHILARRFDHFIAISDPVAELWQEVNRRASVSIVPNGFDIAEMANTRPVQLPWPASREHYVVILVADMVEWKQHRLFLDGVRQALPQLPHLRALVVGRPLSCEGKEYYSFLRQYSNAAGIDEVVHFVDFAEDALPWIAASDVVISTSDREPFGRTVIEGLALGKPVVAVRNIGLADILDKSGAALLVDGSAVAVAAGIRWWATPELRRKAASTARKTAAQFSISKTIDQITSIYRKLLEGGGAER